VLELPNRAPDERRLRGVEARERSAEQFLALLGELGQHRRQIHDELPIEVQRDGANIPQRLRLFRLFLQLPRLFAIDVLVRAVGEAHDEAHGAREVTELVGFGDFAAARRGVAK